MLFREECDEQIIALILDHVTKCTHRLTTLDHSLASDYLENRENYGKNFVQNFLL
jgi:hypothetical protein